MRKPFAFKILPILLLLCLTLSAHADWFSSLKVYKQTHTGSLVVDSAGPANTIAGLPFYQEFAFLDTVTGYSTVVTDSGYCVEVAALVHCRFNGATGTSNATAHALQHLPVPIRARIAQLVTLPQITDTSTVFYSVKATVNTDGSVSLSNNGTAFKNIGTFAITAGTTFEYNLLP